MWTRNGGQTKGLLHISRVLKSQRLSAWADRNWPQGARLGEEECHPPAISLALGWEGIFTSAASPTKPFRCICP